MCSFHFLQSLLVNHTLERWYLIPLTYSGDDPSNDLRSVSSARLESSRLHETQAYHHCKADGRSLNDSADNHNQRTNKNRPPPSQSIPDNDNPARTHQASYFVNGDHKSLDRTAFVFLLHLRESLEEDGLRDDAGHDALVVACSGLSVWLVLPECDFGWERCCTEQEEAAACGEADSDLQRLAADLGVGTQQALVVEEAHRWRRSVMVPQCIGEVSTVLETPLL